MINFLILITWLAVVPACEDQGGSGQPSGSLTTDESAAEEDEEYLRQAQQNQPHAGNNPPPLKDTNLLQGSGPEITSAFPPEVDRDVDGFVDQALPNHPEFPVDNCPAFYNPEQEDQNANGVGDACE